MDWQRKRSNSRILLAGKLELDLKLKLNLETETWTWTWTQTRAHSDLEAISNWSLFVILATILLLLLLMAVEGLREGPQGEGGGS